MDVFRNQEAEEVFLWLTGKILKANLHRLVNALTTFVSNQSPSFSEQCPLHALQVPAPCWSNDVQSMTCEINIDQNLVVKSHNVGTVLQGLLVHGLRQPFLLGFDS